MNTWNILNAWNAAISGSDREVTSRDYLYASELGGADIDTILKLRGTKPTNPPNARSRRKFFAGNIFEDILFLALLRCGLMLDSQKKGEIQYDGLLRVSGRCDFICGGEINYEKCEQEIKDMKLSEHMELVSIQVLKSLSNEYGSMTLKPMVVECKSASDFMFRRYEKIQMAAFNHRLQAFHYLKSFHMDEARVVYINKDDCRMLEFPVFNPLGGASDIEETYKSEIKRLTEYYHSSELPPKEPEIIFESGFKKNWKVEYSNYLTMLYGYKEPFEYAEKMKSICSRWNRIVKRLKDGKELTKDNKAGINEIKAMIKRFKEGKELADDRKAGLSEINSMFPDFEQLIEKIRNEDVEVIE
ncbi:MAG: hypothetical protein LC109_02955 [Bacteroidia bacterium]|nr:hypothetical protein [Bacteroidia bacterium]